MAARTGRRQRAAPGTLGSNQYRDQRVSGAAEPRGERRERRCARRLTDQTSQRSRPASRRWNISRPDFPASRYRLSASQAAKRPPTTPYAGVTQPCFPSSSGRDAADGAALVQAAPTILVGVLVAAIFDRCLGAEGTRRVFGGRGWKSFLCAWAWGMMLPVCSLGVIPIVRQMRCAGLSGGTHPGVWAHGASLQSPLGIVRAHAIQSRCHHHVFVLFAGDCHAQRFGLGPVVSRYRDGTEHSTACPLRVQTAASHRGVRCA